MDAFVDLDLEACAHIQDFHDRLEQKNLFEVLGVDAHADLVALRRAYFERSKQFHPDRYYSRRLGPYKRMLERIFQWCSAAFKFLKDEDQRELYKERVLRLSEPRDQQASPARIVPVELDSGLEFVISEESTPPEQAARSSRKPRAPNILDSDELDTLEFVVNGGSSKEEEEQQTDAANGLEFVIDD